MGKNNRYKFVTPQAHDPLLKQKKPLRKTPKKASIVITADVHTPSSAISEGVSIETLLGKVNTPLVKQLVSLKCQRSLEDLVEGEISNTTTYENTNEMPDPIASASQPENEKLYVFPTSPGTPKKVLQRTTRKQSCFKKCLSSRSLVRYVLATLKEIEEIRIKRKILKEQGINGFKRLKPTG